MKQKHLLYVEDDERLRDEISEYFIRHKWAVDTAKNGNEALTKLRGGSIIFSVMILDLRMPDMSGEELLEAISDENIPIPPVIILSGYLEEDTEDTTEKCRYLGATHILKKPCSTSELEQLATLASKGVRINNLTQHFGATTIDYMVKRRETALKEFLRSTVCKNQLNLRFNEPVFIVGRRWNSWYPSVFPVPGGAYAIVSPKSINSSPYLPDSTPTIVIDPGFRFLEIFHDLGIPLTDVECCIITHNHPDHIGGIFEYMAARHACGKRTRAFCNPSAGSLLSNYVGFNLEVKELDDKYVDAIHAYLTSEASLRVRVKAFNTFHEEIGLFNSSKGLIFTVQVGENSNYLEDTSDVVILGDTEYDHANHRDAIIPLICRTSVKMVALHIGCSELKQATGKHLYLKGLEDILRDMDSELRVIKYPGKLPVIISEWGLEHATKQQLQEACGFSLKGFNHISPIQETIRLLQKDLKKIILIPADIGLIVGMQTGSIYFLNGERCKADETLFEITNAGINYANGKNSKE
jgi:CheY-like chemotaxis protein